MESLIKIVKQIFYIIEGYFIWIWNIITFKTHKKAIYRLELCNSCKYNENGICSECGCIIKAKVRVNFNEDKNGKSIDGCPKNKW